VAPTWRVWELGQAQFAPRGVLQELGIHSFLHCWNVHLPLKMFEEVLFLMEDVYILVIFPKHMALAPTWSWQEAFLPVMMSQNKTFQCMFTL
jgi:hypothetical protein